MARHRLSLHHLTAHDVGPAEFVEITGRLGVSLVCLFTCGMPGSPFPLVTADNEAEVRDRLRASGVALYNAEFVALTPQMAWSEIERSFVVSARLGAQRMTVHCFDTEMDRARESFVRVCRLAANEGMGVNLEWTAVNPAINALAKAERFIADAGQPNAGLAMDVLHLTRCGDQPSDIAAIPVAHIPYGQISDGPRMRSLAEYADIELMYERLPPGDGELPIAEFLAALPDGIVVDVEAPQRTARAAGESAFERSRRAVEAARRFLV